MATAAVKIKVMPSSPEANLEKIKVEISKILSGEGTKNPNFEEHPIAFGLRALVVVFGWPEEKELENLEKRFSKIENVNSVELLDIRRAVG